MGVLTADRGWQQDGSARALSIDAPISDPDRSTTPATAGGSGAQQSLTSGRSGTGFVTLLAMAFVGGLILNLMPCVFPVLAIKVLGFINEAGSDRRRIVLHGMSYTLGVLISFWVLAAALAMLRAGGHELGWGFQLQSPRFVFALGVVMLVFALSLSGVFEFGLRAVGVGANLQMKRGQAGSFMAGVLATVVATPCSAPLLAPALGAALSVPTAQSFVLFTCIALGVSAPYLLLCLRPQAMQFMPRPGRWMETFRQLMAFPLYATAAFLIWVLAGQTVESGLLLALLGMTVIALAAWLYGRWRHSALGTRRLMLIRAAALALLIAGISIGWPRAPTSTGVTWERWTGERVEELRAEGRPIYVDFTARWCATCQANKTIVFASAEVQRLFREKKVAALRADWTNADPRITAELARWNRSAVPFNLVYLPGQEPRVLPEILTPSLVMHALVQR
ncbi:MAG TPA: thioredoxin family protein [Povalibacter sp.]|nr:thioredoxin family protein [Povalibacter sp.]